jgi:hypothetical protein
MRIEDDKMASSVNFGQVDHITPLEKWIVKFGLMVQGKLKKMAFL